MVRKLAGNGGARLDLDGVEQTQCQLGVVALLFGRVPEFLYVEIGKMRNKVGRISAPLREPRSARRSRPARLAISIGCFSFATAQWAMSISRCRCAAHLSLSI